MTVTTREARLDNGLKVLLREVHTAPVTSTWIWYRVGSRNEVEGHTGMSHWVEHMMFKGSSHFPKGTIMRAVGRHGGYVNAMTSHDFTTYYATMPSDQAELVLQIEADRMTTATFDPDEVNAERTVVIAEREGSENEPHYVLAEEVSAAAFRVHPYHHQVVGWKEDLLHITRDQLHAHYEQYYVPNNAVLVVVGDFDSASYLDLVKGYFGDIPSRGLSADAARKEHPQRGERRVTVRMPGAAPIMRISYHAPPVSHPDYIPLVVLDAVLSGGKAMFAFGGSVTRSARLYRALVETQLASSVGSSYHPSVDPFLFSLGATVREGREAVEVEEALLAEISRLQDAPPDKRELQVAIRQTQAQFAYSSESVTSQALTMGFLDMVDDYKRMEGILDELARVTPEDVLRVAQTYLTSDNRTVGTFMPTENGGGSAEHPPVAAYWEIPNRGMFAYRAPQSTSIGPETVLRQELDNGITVLVKENPASASVTIEGSLLAGSLHDIEATTGQASLTASMLRRGTQSHTFQEINEALDDVGASLSIAAERDEVGFGGRALAQDFDLLVGLLAEILITPTFPEAELEKIRGQILTQLDILAMDTGYRADRAFMSALYPPGHAYARSVVGTRETVSAFSAKDLVHFHQSTYQPGGLVLSIVGAIDASKIMEKVSSTLGQWHVEGPVHRWFVPPAETPAKIITQRVDIPGKSQADLILGVIGMTRRSPDYYPAMMANIILGQLGLMGRLGDKVRDDQGLAYYVTSGLQASLGTRPWDIVAGVNPQKVEQAVAAILQEIQRLRDEPVSKEEFHDCKTYLLGSLPLRLETNGGISGFLLNVEKYGLGMDYLQRFPEIIGRVTREDIQRVVNKYLTLDRYVLAMAGTFD